MIAAQASNVALKHGLPMLPLHMDAALIQFRHLVAQAVDTDLR